MANTMIFQTMYGHKKMHPLLTACDRSINTLVAKIGFYLAEEEIALNCLKVYMPWMTPNLVPCFPSLKSRKHPLLPIPKVLTVLLLVLQVMKVTQLLKTPSVGTATAFMAHWSLEWRSTLTWITCLTRLPPVILSRYSCNWPCIWLVCFMVWSRVPTCLLFWLVLLVSKLTFAWCTMVAMVRLAKTPQLMPLVTTLRIGGILIPGFGCAITSMVTIATLYVAHLYM